MDAVETLQGKLSSLEQKYYEMKADRDKGVEICEDMAAEIESLRQERNASQADLAQMKSTLSDTQQTLRAVQEDRDEFAAKMNDAAERAEQLQARCGDLEQDVARLTEEKKWHLDEICGLNGQIEAFRFVVEHCHSK